MISNNGTARTSDEPGATPATGGAYYNVKFNVNLPIGTSLSGLVATITCTGASTNGLQHKGHTTTPANGIGNRGAFVFDSGLYSNETANVIISAPAPDLGGTTTEPAYKTFVYTIPNSILVPGTIVPLQFTFKGIGAADVPIRIVFTKSAVSAGGLSGTSWQTTSATTGALVAN